MSDLDKYSFIWKELKLKGNDANIALILRMNIQPMTFTDICKTSCLTKKSVSRTLKLLSGKGFVIKDADGLYSIPSDLGVISKPNEVSKVNLDGCQKETSEVSKVNLLGVKSKPDATVQGVSGPISPKEVVSNPYTSSSTTPKDTDTDTETDTEKRKLSYPLKGTLNEKKKILRKAKTEAPKTSEDSGTQKPEVTVEHVSPLDSFFQQFWNDYPAGRRKNNKPACYTWIKNHIKKAEYGAVLTGLDLWKDTKEWTREDGEYIPAPLVWLHQRRWESIKPDDNDPMSIFMKASDECIRAFMPGPEAEAFIRKRDEMGMNPDR